jgi:protein gp37
MNETKIGWTRLTWNPLSGCTKVSEGCDHCYAEAVAEPKRGTKAFPNGFEITLRPHKLAEPARVRLPSLIFANSMSDFFHQDIDDGYRDQIFDVIEASPLHRFQVLTKRPKLAAKYFATRPVPANLWLGVTVENRTWRSRIDVLRNIDARVRFLSCEPLLEDLGQLDLRGVHWVIAGGESGAHLSSPDFVAARALVRRARPCAAWQPRTERIAWMRSIRDQCVSQRVAFFLKQWGGTRPLSAGRELDGRTWDEMPTHVVGAMPGPVST